jgi:NADH-quinone oxidoreductase subunit L
MFRLIAMTFYGSYRGPAWESAAERAEDSGPAEPHDQVHGGGHRAWHGPHDAPPAMVFPLMALALGAIIAGFVGVPAALGGGNAIEQFLEPSFTPARIALREPGVRPNDVIAGAELARGRTAAGEVRALEHGQGATEESGARVSRAAEILLMAFSVAIAVAGIALARKFFVTSPEIPERLATRWSGAHRTLLNKYYVDELYDATVINGTFSSARGLWTFDRRVVDGIVNGSGWVTLFGSWLSGLADRTIVDGLVNLVGRICEEGSYRARMLQTGLVQNYALLMLFGIFAFVTIYLFVR